MCGGAWVPGWSRRAGVALAAVLVVLAWAVAEPARASGPLSLTGISPTSGSVGTLVTLTGTGLASRDVVMFNGRGTSPISVSSTGTRLQARVPAFATSGVVSVEDPNTGQLVSLPNSPFTVTSGVYASPSRVWAGGRLTLSGSRLSPDQTEPIYISGRRVGSVTTDRFGNFQVGVLVPWDEHSGKLSIYVVDPRIGSLTTILFALGAWPEFRHDSGHLGVQTWETALTPSSVPKLAAKWNFPTGAAVTTGMVVANGILYAASQDGSLYARNAGTGKALWSYATGGPITSTPAVDNNRVFVYSTGGIFYALNATTGKLLWQRSIGADSDSSPVTANGVVYVGTHYDGNLYALNESTGGMLWNFPTNYPLDSPAVANGIVYVGSQAGYVYAVKATTGLQVWKRNTGKIIDSSPAVAGGQMYIANDSGTVYSLNASTGSVTWSLKLDGYPIRDSPAVAGGSVFIGTDYGRVYSITISTGTVKWFTTPGFLIRSSPAIANGVLYIGDAFGGNVNFNVDALNTATGKLLWTAGTGGSDSSPAVSNGMVYVGSNNQYVYAFGL
jgi:outer membrane protein assembly factor BamB